LFIKNRFLYPFYLAFFPMPPTTRSKTASGPRVVPRGISAGRAKRLVWDKHYDRTQSGLTRKDLRLNDHNKVVSIAKYEAGKALQKAFNYEDQKAFMKHAGTVGKRHSKKAHKKVSKKASKKASKK
jgi:hypothetical protein